MNEAGRAEEYAARPPGAALLLAGVGFALVAHVPAAWPTLNAFDPWKRVVWCLLIAGAAWRPQRRPEAVPGAASWAWLLLVGWVVARSALRPHPFAELDVTATWLLPLAALAAGWRLRGDRSGRPFAVALAAVAVAQALLMLLQFAGLDPLFGATTRALEHRPARMIGTIGYQNQAADVVALGAAGLFLAVRSTPLRLALSALLLGVIAMTGNRAALAAAVLAMAAGQLALGVGDRARRRRSWLAVCALAAAVVPIIALVPASRERFADLLRHGTDSPAIASRRPLWGIASEMWAERPLVGHGGGTFALEYVERLARRLPEPKEHRDIRHLAHAREAHMDILQFGAEFGAIGVGLAAALVLLLFRRTASATTPASASSHALAGAVQVLVYMAGAGCASFPWQSAMAGPLAALALAVWLPARPAAAGARGGALSSIALRALSALLLAWSLVDARLAFAVPARLEAGRPGDAVALLPPWGHRYLALAGAAYAARGELDEAERALSAAREGYLDANLLRNLGYVRAARGDWDGAIAAYTLWARCGIEHRTALDNLSVACARAGDPARAAALLTRRMMMWPEPSVPDTARLAQLRYEAGDYSGAVAAIRRLLARNRWPRERLPPELNNLAGASLLQLGRLDEARAWFEAALAMNPALESARRNLEALPPKSQSPRRDAGGPLESP